MGSWSCPNEMNGVCLKVKMRPCDPGMKGCILYGRFVFSDTTKNRPARRAGGDKDGATGRGDGRDPGR